MSTEQVTGDAQAPTVAEVDEFDFLFKVILVGDQGCGKSSIANRFVKNEFREDSKPTIGVEFATRTIKIDSHKVRIQIWDTAGQERFRGLTHAYYRGAVGALLVYDILSPKTFHSCERWASELEQHCDNKDLNVILIGNKADQKHLREVSKDEAERFGRDHDFLWLETSAADGTNIEEAFVELLRHVLKGHVRTETEPITKPTEVVPHRRDDVIRLENLEPIKVDASGTDKLSMQTNPPTGSCNC